MSHSKTHVVGRRICEAGVTALASFAVLDLVLGALSPRWDAGALWVRGGVLPVWLVQGLVACFSSGVLAGRRLPARAASVLRVLGVLLAVACLADAIGYYRLLAEGRLATALPVPLSLLLALLLLLWALGRPLPPIPRTAGSRRALWVRVLDTTAPLCMLGVGLGLHLLAFGATDYRRPADVAVVFGAAVRASGEPSQALRDRTLTACELYHQGWVRRLVLSGGRDPAAPLSEPACMARIAIEAGVPREALVLDEQGRTTAASLASVGRLAAERGWTRILMVSHDYHLARISLASRRAGLGAVTVPAREARPLLAKPWFVLREMAAYALYFVRAGPFAGPV